MFSFVYDHQSNVVYGAMLDEYGEIKDIQPYYFLTSPLEVQPRNNFNADPLSLGNSSVIRSEFYNDSNGESEFNKIKNLVLKYKPHLVVVAANNI